MSTDENADSNESTSAQTDAQSDARPRGNTGAKTAAGESCFAQLDQVLDAAGMSDPADRGQVRAICKPVSFAQGASLHRAGEVADSVYFIHSGLVRFYYLTEDGREHNKSFALEGQFAGAIQHTLQPAPSRFHIQALEPTATLAISLQGLGTLYHQSLAWANFGRLCMESLAVRKSKREAAFLLDSAEQRYQDFIHTEPELVQRLPLYHVASYLGITDVALSRIRRRLKQGQL